MKSRLTPTAQALAAAGALALSLSAFAQQDAQSNPGATQAARAQAGSTQAGPETIRDIQQALRERGYDVGQPDGKWGPRTQDALRQFQRKQGLEVTGQIDPQTVSALGLTDQPVSAAAGTGADGALAANTMRVSKLEGMKVQNSAGEDLGRIEDLVIDMNNARVHYAVLSFGGTMGLGDKLFAYPMRTLALGRTGNYLQLDVPKERLAKAPGFDSGRAPDWSARNRYREDVDRYFGDVVKIEQRPNMLLRRASDIVGKDVEDGQENDIGEIEDVVVDMKDGRVHYAVISFDQGWFARDRLAAMPLGTLRTETDEDNNLVVRLSREQVAQAPGFNRGEWPDLADRGFRSDVERWFAGLRMDDDQASANRDADQRPGASGER
jgi:peptidoglycan hydrolase-like protein with peptidoglycan-binding domain